MKAARKPRKTVKRDDGDPLYLEPVTEYDPYAARSRMTFDAMCYRYGIREAKLQVARIEKERGK